MTGADVLKIRLPYLPPKELSPNSRLHWSKRQDEKHRVRFDVMVLVTEMSPQSWPKPLGREYPLEHAVVRFTFGLPDKRRRDQDNLLASCKAHLDALVSIGVLVDDSWQHVRLELECVYSKGEPFTEIEVRG